MANTIEMDEFKGANNNRPRIYMPITNCVSINVTLIYFSCEINIIGGGGCCIEFIKSLIID